MHSIDTGIFLDSFEKFHTVHEHKISWFYGKCRFNDFWLNYYVLDGNKLTQRNDNVFICGFFLSFSVLRLSMDTDADMTVTLFFIHSNYIMPNNTYIYSTYEMRKKDSAILHDRVKISTIFRDCQTSRCNHAINFYMKTIHEMAKLFYDSIIYIIIFINSNAHTNTNTNTSTGTMFSLILDFQSANQNKWCSSFGMARLLENSQLNENARKM